MEFFSRPYTFWAGMAGGCFLTTASHGTDQLMVQRLLSARNQADSRKALLASWVLVAFQFTLFLLIGVLLWVYYGDRQSQRRRPTASTLNSSGTVCRPVWPGL
jgi:solute:Na+ symporter, SSS family